MRGQGPAVLGAVVQPGSQCPCCRPEHAQLSPSARGREDNLVVFLSEPLNTRSGPRLLTPPGRRAGLGGKAPALAWSCSLPEHRCPGHLGGLGYPLTRAFPRGHGSPWHSTPILS